MHAHGRRQEVPEDARLRGRAGAREFTVDVRVDTIRRVTTDPPGRPHGVDADRILAQPLFASLTRHDAEEFVRYCEVRHVESGHPVFTQGGLAVAFFAIESGEAEAVADGEALRQMGPGDWFGEIGIVQHSPRTATVSATSPLTLIAMTAFEFRRLEAEHPDIAATLTTTMQERLGS
jgi:CRP/FNR family cyclic AMP-dependent transcriptional regulator